MSETIAIKINVTEELLDYARRVAYELETTAANITEKSPNIYLLSRCFDDGCSVEMTADAFRMFWSLRN